MQHDSMTRRRFLATSAACGIVLCGQKAQAAPTTKIGFGFSLYGMKSLPTSQALKVCSDIGYSGVELACLKDWPCDPNALKKSDRESLRSELTDLDLDLPCLMDNLTLVGADEQHQANLERLKLLCQLSHDLSSPDGTRPLLETVLGGKPQDWPSVKEKMVERLRDWEKVAAGAETVLAVKPHAFGALHTPQDARWLADQIGSKWIRLVYDYSHFQRQSLDLKESLSTMLPLTAFIHIKDNVTKDGKTEFALPGDAGDIDYASYLILLRDSGYGGSVVVEVSAQVSGKPDYNPIAAAKRCYQKIQPAFIKAGLRAEF